MPEQGIYHPNGSFHKVSPIVEKPFSSSDPSLNEQISHLKDLQEYKKSHEIWKDEIDIKATTQGLPFMFMALSDLHIGASGADYDALKERLLFLRDYPVSAILVGDLADNFSPMRFPSSMSENLVEPTDQWRLARSFFKEFQDKILVNVGGGQHDEWVKRISGIDIFQWMTEDLNIPLLKSGGVVNFQVDDQKYKIRLFHKIGRLNSQFNYTHAGKQALRLAGDDSDLIITGDKHLGAVEQTHIGDRKRTICQLGTLKVEDDFGRSQGYPQRPIPFYPVFMLFGDQHNVEVVENLDSAKKMIDATFQYYKQLGVGSLGLRS